MAGPPSKQLGTPSKLLGALHGLGASVIFFIYPLVELLHIGRCLWKQSRASWSKYSS